VPEGRQIFQTLTVRENLNVPVRGRSQQKDAVEEVLALFPVLEDRLDGSAGLLSGGEQQMLALARALVMRPRLILVDEPSLGLAPLVVAKVYECFARLRADGVTLVIVEQSISRVLAIADHAYLLSKGRVVLAGRPEEIAERSQQDERRHGCRADARGSRR
jgi:branched-chain amino acid transport system ATP-binding protein